MKARLCSSLACLALAGATQAGTFIISDAFTDPASTGISSSKEYTHAISGGEGVTINGVDFEPLSPLRSATNFTWTSTGGTASLVTRFGDWDPAPGIAGTSVEDLLSGFTFAPGGANPGHFQTFSLLGLTPGEQYETRMYIRVWDEGGSGRPIDIFTMNGGEMDMYFDLNEDRPQEMVPGGSVDDAYYFGYSFTAQSDRLDIYASVLAGGEADSGSFHLYGLTNEVIPEPSQVSLLGLGVALLFMRRRRRD